MIEGKYGKGWLTVPELCEWLRVSPEDWAAFHEETGDRPPYVTGPGGVELVRYAHLVLWLDSRTVRPLHPFTEEFRADFRTARAEYERDDQGDDL